MFILIIVIHLILFMAKHDAEYQLQIAALNRLFPDATCPAFIVQRGGRSGASPFAIIGVQDGVVLSLYAHSSWLKHYQKDPERALTSFLQDERFGTVTLYRDVTPRSVGVAVEGFADGLLGDFSSVEEGTQVTAGCLAQLPAKLATVLATPPNAPTGYKPLSYRFWTTIFRYLITIGFFLLIGFRLCQVFIEKSKKFLTGRKQPYVSDAEQDEAMPKKKEFIDKTYNMEQSV
jgi:hypothetical protein